jgi:uncharacterized protein YbjT (DUF2867 family)
MKRVLVAGATGYLGGFVTKELKNRGCFVRALARSAGKLGGIEGDFDETHIGEITKPETLEGICDGIDMVFSSIGITKQRDGLTFRDVDYQGNKNLLEIAQKAGVKKFVYVSVLNGPALRHLDIVNAHEEFVDELKASGMDYTVVRPTGYFSDMGELFDMADKGRVYLFGNGNSRTNPIHGADLAVGCVDSIENDETEVEFGGPEILTWRQVARLAFEAQYKPVKVTSIPVWAMKTVLFATRLFNRHSAELLAFFTTMSTRDVIGPITGSHTLQTHYQELGRSAAARIRVDSSHNEEHVIITMDQQ